MSPRRGGSFGASGDARGCRPEPRLPGGAGTVGACVGVLGGAFLLTGVTGGDDGFTTMGVLALGAGALVAVPGYVVMGMNETSVEVRAAD